MCIFCLYLCNCGPSSFYTRRTSLSEEQMYIYILFLSAGLFSDLVYLHWEATWISQCEESCTSCSWRSRIYLEKQIRVWCDNSRWGMCVCAEHTQFCRAHAALNILLTNAYDVVLQLMEYRRRYQIMVFQGALMLQKPVPKCRIVGKSEGGWKPDTF